MKIGSLLPFQQSALSRLEEKILGPKDYSSSLLLAATGTGKTFVCGEYASKFKEKNKDTTGWSLSNTPILYVTASNVVLKARREFDVYWGLNEQSGLTVTSYSSLRATEGKRWLGENSIGELVAHPFIGPLTLILDEPHNAKNFSSQQTKAILGFRNLISSQNLKVLLSGASPFSCVQEAMVFLVMLNVNGLADCKTLYELEHNFKRLALSITKGIDPAKHSPTAMKRFREHIDEYIVRVPPITTKYKSINVVRLINFSNGDQRREYEKAYEDYLVEKAKLNKGGNNLIKANQLMKLAIFRKFWERAESIKVDHFCKEISSHWKEGFAVGCCCHFQATIAKIVIKLVKDYSISRDEISLIWGGNEIFEPLGKRYSNDEIVKIFTSSIETGTDLSSKLVNSIIKQIKQDSRNISSSDLEMLELGKQNYEQRQAQIDHFNSGRRNICLFTSKSGGIGLSLHHSEEYFLTRPDQYTRDTKEPSNWLFNKELLPVPYYPKQRVFFGSPALSPIELVQYLGRLHRITSMSDTRQYIDYFADTSEEQAGRIVAPKLHSLGTLIGSKSDWTGILTQGVFKGGVDGFKDDTIELCKDENNSVIESEDE